MGIVIGVRGRPFSTVTALGYVQAKFRDKQTRRTLCVVWESVNGPIEGDLQVNHLNGQKADNRISNLEVVTASGNVLHAHATGLARPRFGMDNNSTLTPVKARMIYLLAHSEIITQGAIAEQFGITPSTVRHIKHGDSFSWATGHERAAS